MEYPDSVVRPVSVIPWVMLDARYWMLDNGCWMCEQRVLGVGNIEYRTLNNEVRSDESNGIS